MTTKPVDQSVQKDKNRGAWTAEEDRKLAECIAVHGDKRWRSVPAKAGLNRCGKSCRLRWLNYLRPNIKRGNITDQEEDLIIRLHKLLGNRWSLIARRLPGRTDNEIKNYWNSHLSKRVRNQKGQARPAPYGIGGPQGRCEEGEKGHTTTQGGDPKDELNVDDFFDFSKDAGSLANPLEVKPMETFDSFVVSKGGSVNLAWIKEFLEIDDRGFS